MPTLDHPGGQFDEADTRTDIALRGAHDITQQVLTPLPQGNLEFRKPRFPISGCREPCDSHRPFTLASGPMRKRELSCGIRLSISRSEAELSMLQHSAIEPGTVSYHCCQHS